MREDENLQTGIILCCYHVQVEGIVSSCAN